MSIIATNNGTRRELIPAGNYVAICYQMLHIGTVKDTILGKAQILNKVRITWELPDETRVFDEAKGPQPCSISKEFTLSMNEKANLRKMLASWRGKDFSEEETKSFDITKLLGKSCMLNLIHKPAKSDPTKIYEEIGSISPLPKSIGAPTQYNASRIWEYDTPDWDLFEKLPDFIKDMIKGSLEFQALTQPDHTNIKEVGGVETEADGDDLPF